MNDSALRQLLDNDLNNESCKNSSPKNSTLMVLYVSHCQVCSNFAVYILIHLDSFVPITPCTDPQLPGRISLTKGGAEHLFEHFKLNPSFLLQIFGPPSEILAVPQFNLETSSDGKLTCLRTLVCCRRHKFPID